MVALQEMEAVDNVLMAIAMASWDFFSVIFTCLPRVSLIVTWSQD